MSLNELKSANKVEYAQVNPNHTETTYMKLKYSK